VHTTQMIYLYSEIAVVALRGEHRSTETGLPVARPEELSALLWLSSELAKNLGFEAALAACQHRQGKIDIAHGDEIFEIAAPILRVIPSLTQFVTRPQPPSLDEFVETLAAVPQLTASGGTCSA